nr:hypothetical protein Iba_chr04cCG13610 [Ipomoea batatas]GMD76361.1 hypothetical protein Iba_chr13bCG9640 [Ipomoea batatas]
MSDVVEDEDDEQGTSSSDAERCPVVGHRGVFCCLCFSTTGGGAGDTSTFGGGGTAAVKSRMAGNSWKPIVSGSSLTIGEGVSSSSTHDNHPELPLMLESGEL